MERLKKESNGMLPTITESEVVTTASASNNIIDNNSEEASSTTAGDAIVTNSDNDENDKDPVELTPLWSGSVDGWHLSWPIWHMLPRHERKDIAQQHGYKSIGEFEEYMSLQQAVDSSELNGSSIQKPYSNYSIYGTGTKTTEEEEDKKPAAAEAHAIDSAEEGEDDADEDNNDSSSENDRVPYGRQGSSIVSGNTEGLSVEELMAVGGKLLMIHDELLHTIFCFLPVDAYGTLALVSPHWKHLTRTEAVYRRLCERLYLNQSKRRQLHVSRFGGSYRRMLEVRPRVRAAGGCYVLKYSQIKQIQRDMWTEVPVGAILESIYYR
jgi:F-box protein 9